MNIYDDVHAMIGHTPIIKLRNFDVPKNVKIFAKLESENPGGSVKDRMGQWIIEKAESNGTLKPGMTILEATAGNTGIALALASLHKDYELILVVPDKFSIEKQKIMRALGATLINTEESKGLKGAFEEVERLKEKYPNHFIPNQFSNHANPEIHYMTTGKEIHEQMDGKIDLLVSGAGTGGTLSGVMRYLKEKNANVQSLLVDPEGSTMGGGSASSYKIEGIGNDFMPETMDMSLVDHIEKVNDEEAYLMVKTLAKQEGLLVGSSSGAAMVGALRAAQQMDQGNIVVIFPDRAERYLSKDILD